MPHTEFIQEVKDSLEDGYGGILRSFLSSAMERSTSYYELERVLKLPEQSVNELWNYYFLAGELLETSLNDLNTFLNSYKGKNEPSEEIFIGEVKGTVLWQQTLRERNNTGNQFLFVCQVPRRTFDSFEGRVIARFDKLLRRIFDSLKINAGTKYKALNEQIMSNKMAFDLLLEDPVYKKIITQATKVGNLSATALAQWDTMYPSYNSIASAIKESQYRFEAKCSSQMEAYIETEFYTFSKHFDLFEYVVQGLLINFFTTQGFEINEHSIFKSITVLERDEIRVRIIHNQSLDKSFSESNSLFEKWFTNSKYQDLRKMTFGKRSALRPDHIIHLSTKTTEMVVIVEDKCMEAASSSFRASMLDLLGYFHDIDAQDILREKHTLYGLGVGYKMAGKRPFSITHQMGYTDFRNLDVALAKMFNPII